MPDYSKAKIYKIVDNTSDKCYVGSTCEPTLARRLAKHVSDYKRYVNGKHNNVTSFKIIENGNYDIQLIEGFPCETKDQLHAREGYWIQQTACVNKVVAGRTQKQYYEENKELFNQKHKQYYEQNKDKIREYREQNKDKKKQYYEQNKDKIKQYRKQYKEKNRELLSQKNREYKEQNKDKLYEKHDCPCGGRYNRSNLTHHKKTKQHKQYEFERYILEHKPSLDDVTKYIYG
jgi:hypothetical protein